MKPRLIGIWGAIALLATLCTTMLSVRATAASNKQPSPSMNRHSSEALSGSQANTPLSGAGPALRWLGSFLTKTIVVVAATIQAVRNGISPSLMYYTEESGGVRSWELRQIVRRCISPRPMSVAETSTGRGSSAMPMNLSTLLNALHGFLNWMKDQIVSEVPDALAVC